MRTLPILYFGVSDRPAHTAYTQQPKMQQTVINIDA